LKNMEIDMGFNDVEDLTRFQAWFHACTHICNECNIK
jgi:hypothetical protein